VTLSGTKLIGIAASSIALVAGTATTAAAAVPAPARSVLQAQEDAIVAAGTPGVSAEVRDPAGVWRGVSGVGDVRNASKPDAGGEIRVGSISKTFIATMVLQLVAEHRVDLDTPVADYLPGLLPYPQPITVRELLQHRSGISDYVNSQPSAIWPTPESISTYRFRHYSPGRLIAIGVAKPLLFTPGSQWSYSNTNYVILGQLIEKVSGHPVTAELDRRILAPLHLRHTYLAGDFPLLPHPAEHGYEQLAAVRPLTDLTTYNMTWGSTAGAVVSTEADLNRFYDALLTGGLLPAAQLREMQRTVPMSDIDNYGLGLIGTTVCGTQIWGHDGSVPGYATYSFSSADGSRQITVSANQNLSASPASGQAINRLLATEFCGAVPSAAPAIARASDSPAAG
jgi:D-alanyl-D-alanine carboxypeptidase